MIIEFNTNTFAADVEATAAAFGLKLGFDSNTCSKDNWDEKPCLVGGKTFPVKDALRAAGARWNGFAKAWEFPTETALAAGIRSLTPAA